jgi:hypothetical protein
MCPGWNRDRPHERIGTPDRQLFTVLQRRPPAILEGVKYNENGWRWSFHQDPNFFGLVFFD